MHVAMLLSNPFRPDPRVLKEAVSLVQAGHDVTVICWDRASEMRPDERLVFGVRIIRVQDVPSSYGLGTRQLLRVPLFWLAILPILNHIQPEVVHCHDFDTLPVGLLWGRLHRRPVIYDAHEYYADLCKPRLRGAGGKLLYWLIHISERIGAYMASAVVTVDQSLGNIYGRLNQRVVILDHYPNRALAAKAATIFARSDLTLLYIGRLSEDRGLLIYVDILRRLRERGILACLRLAGDFTPPEEEHKLYERWRAVEDFVDVVGWVPYGQVPALLRSADVGLVLLQPESRYKVALPVKILEYMAVGLPIVASDFPPITAIIKEAQCGVVVNPLDPEAAVEHIAYWCEHPNEAQAIGENGRQAVLETYHWEALVERLDRLYVALAEQGACA